MRRYTDSILRAAILRGAISNELRRAKESKEFERVKWFRERLVSKEEVDRQLRREILVGVLADKVPIETLDSSVIDSLRAEGYEEFCDLVVNKRL